MGWSKDGGNCALHVLFCCLLLLYFFSFFWFLCLFINFSAFPKAFFFVFVVFVVFFCFGCWLVGLPNRHSSRTTRGMATPVKAMSAVCRQRVSGDATSSRASLAAAGARRRSAWRRPAGVSGASTRWRPMNGQRSCMATGSSQWQPCLEVVASALCVPWQWRVKWTTLQTW